MEYTKYKGYYIGTGPNDFHSKAEIDEFILARAVKRLNMLVGFFVRDHSMEASALLSDHEMWMIDVLGLTPAQVEDMEIAAMGSARR